MTEFPQKIGFIGAGNMGEAMIGALIKSGLVSSSWIRVADIRQARLAYLRQTYGVDVVGHNDSVFNESAIVFLAVKPQQIVEVLSGLTLSADTFAEHRKLFISIAAGFPIKRIEELLYASLEPAQRKNLPIIRVMPNTPAFVLTAMSGISANRYATADDVETAHRLLQTLGTVLEFEERELDAVTAVSGSGPAYVFYLAESMLAAALNVGLDPEAAKTLVLTTLKGAVKLMESTGESAEELRRKVTSPGGTTEAALGVFEKNGFKQTVVDAIEAAARRAAELSS